MKKRITPFIYGNTVSEAAFTNRKNEVKKLYDNLTNGINTLLISPRRWGKSSLVEKVLNEIDKQGKQRKIVLIDLFTISSEEEFLEVYAREILKASSSQWEDWISAAKEFFQQLIPKITIGTDPLNDFNIGFNWEELKKHSEEILNLPEAIAKRKKTKFIIALDEFQNLATLKDYEQFEKKLRAIWQRQKEVCYCLYGSKRHMLAEIFSNPSKPFFRFGDIMFLEKISLADWQVFIQERFNSTGKKISVELALLIPDLMGCHSWYVQQFAHYTWQKTVNEVRLEDLNNALVEMIYANMPLFQRDMENTSKTQINLIKAILKGEKKLTSTRVMREFRLGTPRNVSKNLLKLEERDLLHKTKGEYELLDPLFKLWFKKQYFGIDFEIQEI